MLQRKTSVLVAGSSSDPASRLTVVVRAAKSLKDSTFFTLSSAASAGHSGSVCLRNCNAAPQNAGTQALFGRRFRNAPKSRSTATEAGLLALQSANFTESAQLESKSLQDFSGNFRRMQDDIHRSRAFGTARLESHRHSHQHAVAQARIGLTRETSPLDAEARLSRFGRSTLCA
jgi:hypothetical protein